MWLCVMGTIWVSTVSQHLELLGHKKEEKSSKLDAAQCSFCCYSESHPSLSPTHICKIINRCQSGLLWPAYCKHTLNSLHHSIFSVTVALLVCISAFPSLLLTCWCTQATNACKHSQRRTPITHTCSPLFQNSIVSFSRFFIHSPCLTPNLNINIISIKSRGTLNISNVI